MPSRITSTHNLTLQFEPHPLARNPHLQTVLSSLRRQKAPLLSAASREMILDAGHGVRLQGCYAPQIDGQSKGLVLMLHGWLGCVSSSYILAAGERLYRHGYSIFRLNLRDHGDTHRLNPGIFRSDRLDEVVEAVRQVAHLEPERPLHVTGASLGGGFALRLAWRFSQEPLQNLGQTVAICPLVNPYRSTLALDRNPVYLFYFRRRWRRDFRRKQAAFPDKFDLSAELAARSCMSMTETFVRNYSPYADAMAYFEQYTVTPTMLAQLRQPVTILTAADDPIIPVEDFYPFTDCSPHLHLNVQPYGGHVGFIDLFPYRHWLAEALPAILGSEIQP